MMFFERIVLCAAIEISLTVATVRVIVLFAWHLLTFSDMGMEQK